MFYVETLYKVCITTINNYLKKGYYVPMETFPRGTFNIDPWYVTGFVEGEGTFTYSRSYDHMGLYFGIRLTKRDAPILESIQQFFGGIGKIYQAKAHISPKGGRTKSASYFRITRVKDLLKVVEHFDIYQLNGTKQESYKIWRRMVMLKTNNIGKAPKEKLEMLARQLTLVSPRNQKWDGE